MTRALLASTFSLGLCLAVALPGCQQPRSYCSTAHGDFAATYQLKKGDAASDCAKLKGDVIGMQTYFGEGGLNGTPKYGDATMAIRPQYLGDLVARVVDYGVVTEENFALKANAVADFTTEKPDDEDFCEATKFNKVALDLPLAPLIPGSPAVEDDPATPDVDETADEVPDVPEQPATSISYVWTNARVLVSANYQGTQFSADLTFTQDGCTAEYHVVGVYPVASCEADKDCQDTSVTAINPDFDLRCDKDLGLCVLKDEPPALN